MIVKVLVGNVIGDKGVVAKTGELIDLRERDANELITAKIAEMVMPEAIETKEVPVDHQTHKGRKGKKG